MNWNIPYCTNHSRPGMKVWEQDWNMEWDMRMSPATNTQLFCYSQHDTLSIGITRSTPVNPSLVPRLISSFHAQEEIAWQTLWGSNCWLPAAQIGHLLQSDCRTKLRGCVTRSIPVKLNHLMWANCLFPRNNLWDFRQLRREFHAVVGHHLLFTKLQNVEGFRNSILYWQTTHPQWQSLQRRRGRCICVCREHLQDCHAAQPPSHWGHLLCWRWHQKQGLTGIRGHTRLRYQGTYSTKVSGDILD